MEKLLQKIRRIIPKKVYAAVQPIYHFTLACMSAVVYGFPSRKITVIGITGTKGKSTTTELVNCILEEAGYKTALSGTIRFKIGDVSRPNKYKMSMPGRFFMQRFLYEAVKAKCDYAVLEMTSEGSRFYRHRFIMLDALLFTNLAPEHIESHGSYEAYREAKLDIAKQLMRGKSKDTILVVNGDDIESKLFLEAGGTSEKFSYYLTDAEPYTIKPKGIDFTWNGVAASSPLTGEFNLSNTIGALTLTEALAIPTETALLGISKCADIKGRVERIDVGQPFDVVVDYAHTADSLSALYKAFEGKFIVGVLGNTGGGRDTWKRPEMAKIAEEACDHLIFTNEDPYDEDPMAIIAQMQAGIPHTKKPVDIILDRRTAIREALKLAYQHFMKEGTSAAVLITGKGTDPYIMGPNGSKEDWSDAEVAKEELLKLYQPTA